MGKVLAEKSPEEKLEIMRSENAAADTPFVGDGIMDAPAPMSATAGLAFGHSSVVTTEAARAVIMDCLLEKIDELLHISQRIRKIALRSAVGGMLLGAIAMVMAARAYLHSVAGALAREMRDVFTVGNALNVARPHRSLKDF